MTVRAQAYGENCIDPDGNVRYFNATTTDFYLSAQVESLGDLDTAAQIVFAAVDTLSLPMNASFPAKMGYLDLTLISSQGHGILRTSFDQIYFSRAQGLTDGAFIDAIGGVVER